MSTTTREDAAVARELGESDVALAEGGPSPRARSRRVGYWEQVWRRFRRDRVALASIVFLIFVVLICYPGAIIAEEIIGHSPDDQFSDGIDDGFVPVGPWSTVYNPYTGGEDILVLGAADTLGRDEFLRLLYGGRVSLQVAVLATIGAMFIGTVLGAAAGYYRGTIDTVISRLTEITMAFPALLFIIAMASTVGSRLDNITFGGVLGRGVLTLVLVFWVFGWFFPARIIRAKVLSLREKEFVEAALMTGRERLADHPLAPDAAPHRADHRLLDARRRELHPRRGGTLVPRRRHQAADGELGQPALVGARVLHLAAVAHALARARRRLHDARVQPARRRAAGCVRPALEALKSKSPPLSDDFL